MTLREWLLFFHVLAAMVWLGGSVMLLIQSVLANRAPNGADRVRFLRNVDFAGKFVFNPAGITVFIFGLWLVLDSSIYEFSDWWVSLAMLVVIASALLGMFFYGPQTGRALELAGEKGGDDPGVIGISQRMLQVASLETVLLVFVLWTMVFKPGS